MSGTAPIFTAAEIAAALGRKRESVVRVLKAVPATGSKIVSGNEARAWVVEALPERFRSMLKTDAVRAGHKNSTSYLVNLLLRRRKEARR